MPRRFNDTQFVQVSLRTRYTAFNFIGQVMSFKQKDNYCVRFLIPLSDLTKNSYYWHNASFPNCDYVVNCKTHELQEVSINNLYTAQKMVKKFFNNKLASMQNSVEPRLATPEEALLPEGAAAPEEEHRYIYGYHQGARYKRYGKYMLKDYYHYTNEKSKFLQSVAYLSFIVTRTENILSEITEFYKNDSESQNCIIARGITSRFVRDAKVPSLENYFPIQPTTITRSDYV